MVLYIDSENFSTATTVYLDELLSEIAPDGYYSDNVNYRRQIDGKLTDIITCPIIDTVSVTSIRGTTATFNGNFINNGGDATAVRGFVYGTSPNPTTANSVITDASIGTGTYSLNVTGLEPVETYYVRAYSIVFGNAIYGDEIVFTTTTIRYCVSWTAANEGNVKMSTEGYIDFTEILAGRTIVAGLSAGTITGYVVAGMSPFTCSIDMDFTTSRATWETDSLPVVTNKVLTSLIYTVEVVFNNGDDYLISNEQTNAIVIPGQLTSSFNNCI